MTQALLDNLGWTYIGLDIAWTVTLIAGMAFLWHHRELPCLQIRRLPLVFAGVTSLHAYGAVCLISYPLMPLVPCIAEFWLMSIWLPFGIGMFHAANSQFLHIASRQKQFARGSTFSERPSLDEKEAERLASSRFTRIMKGQERADRINRMMVWISIGLAIQLALTLFVFFGSKKFHPSYGIFDYTIEGTGMQVRMECSKGWEWWLSIVWQFFWAWIYAPYMLWKSRGIRDVHGWRFQTICCCLVGLPASPLWLAGLYAPQMATVSQYFLAPMWFSVCIFLMEVFTVAVPVVQVLKEQRLRQETLQALAAWQKRKELFPEDSEVNSNNSSTYTGATYTADGQMTTELPPRIPTPEMYTLTALDHALKTNPEPLLQFAALKDFSGENVSFLTHLAEWKRAWFIALHSSEALRRQQFISSVQIYASFISLDFAEFPINISSREIKLFHQIFSEAATLLLRRLSISSADTITPFDNATPDSSSTIDLKLGINLDTLGRSNLKAVSHMTELTGEDEMEDIAIPEAFCPEIFESAEKEIKYLILTNTWPKFVAACCSSNDVRGVEQYSPWWSRMGRCPV